MTSVVEHQSRWSHLVGQRGTLGRNENTGRGTYNSQHRSSQIHNRTCHHSIGGIPGDSGKSSILIGCRGLPTRPRQYRVSSCPGLIRSEIGIEVRLVLVSQRGMV